MKKNLQKLLAAAGLLFLAGTGQDVQASHVQGTELTYNTVAPGIIVTTLKIYRDCTGIPAPTTATLNLKAPGCNPNGRSVTMTKLGNTRIGNDYCAQLTPTCSASGAPNYEEVKFTATITFTAAELNCPEWLLSWTECCRPESNNLLNASGESFYAEAMVRVGNNINNNSAQFNSLVVPFVGAYKPIILSSFAIDPDGDSLVYSLVDPLSAPNDPIGYDPFQASIVVSPDSTKFMTSPSGMFSKTFPIQSYFVDWTLPAPYTAIPNFVLDPNNGPLSFTPSVYHPNTPSVQGRNKYVVAVQVDEYRSLNNQPVKVGSVRRDMFVTVVDCGTNNNPLVAAPVANNQPITPNTIIELRPGTPLNFTFNATDSNPSDVLQLSSDVAQILPGAVFTKTSANQPTGTISWTPTAADVRGQLYYFHLMVQDDACPIKGQHVQTFAVRVSNNGGVTGLAADQKNYLSLQAYPNPFSKELNFKVNLATPAIGQEIVIYNILGKQVDRISLKGLAAGEQQVRWTNAAKMANGQYVAKLAGFNQAGHSIRFTKLQ